METLAAQPRQEQLRSFDPLASIKMLQYDLANHGFVLPETRQQVHNEELSYLAEGIGRAARTSFVLQRDGDELLHFKEGKWQPYSAMLETGLRTAQHEAVVDPRRQFLANWAQNDLYHYNQMRSLAPGQQYFWASPYAHEQEQRYGAKFMQECGLNPKRQMGFMHRAVCRPDGYVVLESQTIDHSDNEAFGAALRSIDYDPDTDMDSVVRVYDGTLAQKYGGKFYAGRRTEHAENAWEFINIQKDLVVYFMNGLEKIAAAGLPYDQLERAAKEHIYGVWAAFKKRLDGSSSQPNPLPRSIGMMPDFSTEAEVHRAFDEFARAGKVLVGCGGEITMLANKDDIMNAKSEDVFSAIFGDKGDSYKFDKRMYCVKCQAPPKVKGESKKMCGPCGICTGCDPNSIRIQGIFSLFGIG